MAKKPGPILSKVLSMAEEAVEHAQGLDVALDYSLEGLPEVDEILSGLGKSLGDSQDELRRMSGLYGAYVGEVLRAQTKGAKWIIDKTSFEGQSHHCLKRENLRIWPMKKAQKCIRSGEGSMAKYAKEVLRRWDPAAKAERRRAASRASPAQVRAKMEFLAEQAVSHAETLDLDLDYSVQSIAKVETILTVLHESLGSAPSDDDVQLMSGIYGAYIGEALRQYAGAEWGSDGPGDFHLEYEGSVIWPLDKVHERIVNGDEDNVAHYAAGVLRRWLQ
ncbi:MAG: hypothetical protein AB7K71_37420 [Polyangiaceae bacterium]